MLKQDYWQKITFNEICKNVSTRVDDPKNSGYDKYVGLEHLDTVEPKITRFGSTQDVKSSMTLFKKGQILFGRRNWYLRRVAIADFDGVCSADIYVLEPKGCKIVHEFLLIFMHSNQFFDETMKYSAGSMSTRVKWSNLSKTKFLIPSIPDQEKIVNLISHIDDSITKTLQLLEKLKVYKNSKTNELLTRGIGHTKFKKVKSLFGKYEEIPETWEITSLENCCNILDSKRVPINSGERSKMKGDIPYYGANGVQDYINQYIFDEELILLAEDGGNFNEYQTRPIAYFVRGKCWVNNHAHVLTNKIGYELKWIFYSLVHKNILPWIKGSTRTKLNQSELRKIEILMPSLKEQQKIASILSNIDKQIEQLENHFSKLKALRKSILNEKLTPPKLEEKPLVQ